VTMSTRCWWRSAEHVQHLLVAFAQPHHQPGFCIGARASFAGTRCSKFQGALRRSPGVAPAGFKAWAPSLCCGEHIRPAAITRGKGVPSCRQEIRNEQPQWWCRGSARDLLDAGNENWLAPPSSRSSRLTGDHHMLRPKPLPPPRPSRKRFRSHFTSRTLLSEVDCRSKGSAGAARPPLIRRWRCAGEHSPMLGNWPPEQTVSGQGR